MVKFEILIKLSNLIFHPASKYNLNLEIHTGLQVISDIAGLRDTIHMLIQSQV